MTELKAGRKRSESSRLAILQAAFALMEEVGFDRMSIEGVAARAGVGKTTIYRWWESRGVLAVEAFLTMVEPAIAFRETGSAKEDMIAQMQALAELYRGPTGRFVREMIGSSQSDPAMRSAFHDLFLAPRREAARAVFRRGQAAGEFRSDVDADAAIDALYSPIYYRLLASDGPIDERAVAKIAVLVMNGLGAAT
ncbi:TetR/AcrR family transcriptional regulator [Sphingomonas sp. H39-1-10]|uniref:TetR/AcrR family transcriptional regulator n=1 Tax=Sphingomonas TaxID=13687 RepID=UPI000881ADCA|nr:MULTISPECIES: TetR/AcrR family transcriptional regulator [Sphingomonas]MDF0489931.1 TetR/AcrR family transcriptional regulator [Sphingomonas pollutisoli]SDA36951.1 transcriptional regulator, TetR family [Sphingomonas sp. NFR15]